MYASFYNNKTDCSLLQKQLTKYKRPVLNLHGQKEQSGLQLTAPNKSLDP